MKLEELATDRLIDELKRSNQISKKHQIALILSERSSDDILPALVEQIKCKNNEGFRGRFVFACEAFDCSQYSELFVDLVIDGSAEVSMTAVMVIENMKSIPTNKLYSALKTLKNSISKKQENGQFIEDAIFFLETQSKELEKLSSDRTH